VAPSGSSSSSSAASNLFDAARIRVSRQKFDELGSQVQLILATIINADDLKAM
jgi:hypothetical protein